MWEKSKLGHVVRDKKTLYDSSVLDYYQHLIGLATQDEQITQKRYYLEAFWTAYPNINKAITDPSPDVIFEALRAILDCPNLDDAMTEKNKQFVQRLKEQTLQGKTGWYFGLFLSEIILKEGDAQSAEIIATQFKVASEEVKRKADEAEQIKQVKLQAEENARRIRDEQKEAAALKRAEIAASKQVAKKIQIIEPQKPIIPPPLEKNLDEHAEQLLTQLDVATPSQFGEIIQVGLLSALKSAPMFMREKIIKHPNYQKTVIGILRKAQQAILLRPNPEESLKILMVLLKCECEILGFKSTENNNNIAQEKLALTQLLKTPELSDAQIQALLTNNALGPDENIKKMKMIIDQTCIMLLKSMSLFYMAKKIDKLLPIAKNLVRLLQFNDNVPTLVNAHLFFDLTTSLNLTFTDDIMNLLTEMESIYNKSLELFITNTTQVFKQQEPRKLKDLYHALVKIILTDRSLQSNLGHFMFAIVAYEGQHSEKKHPLVAAILTLKSYEIDDSNEWEIIIRRLCKKSPLKGAIEFNTEAELYTHTSSAIWTLNAATKGLPPTYLTDHDVNFIKTHDANLRKLIGCFDMHFRKTIHFVAEEIMANNNLKSVTKPICDALKSTREQQPESSANKPAGETIEQIKLTF